MLKLYKAVSKKDFKAINKLNKAVLNGWTVYSRPLAYVIKNGRHQIIAAITLTSQNGTQTEIDTLAVYPQYQRLGLGSWLVNFTKHVSRISGKTSIILGTLASFQATGFYKKLGFEITEFDDYGNEDDCYEMEAEL